MFFVDRRVFQAGLISTFVAHCLLRKCCIEYLAHIVNTLVKEVRLEDIPVGRDFSNELLGLPQEREIDFAIELNLGINPISLPLYRMTPTDLKTLKVSLQELVDKRFIRPSISS